ncbi:MAG: pyrroline-5-carboxylate reductase [Sphingomonas sp.]|nr:pyrroline-5-carboxylate reductase [Sphingomonas sp.]
MAGAMLDRWLASAVLTPADVVVVNRRDRALPPGVAQVRALPPGPMPDAVMLGMKPQQLDDVTAAHAARLAGLGCLISILAGVEEAALAQRFAAGAIVRAMPNLPVAIGQGVVALHSDSATAPVRADVAQLMAPLGLVEWVAPAQFDLVTALAGSGPAFLYRYVDAMSRAGAALGLPGDQAARLALATVAGAVSLATAAREAPAALAERVASPGGSTRKGLDVLDADDALARLLTHTLAAAAARNAELAAAAR